MTEPTSPASPDPAAGQPPANPPVADPASPDPLVPITATAAAPADATGTPPGTDQPLAAPATMESDDWPPDRRLVWGLVAVLLWLLLFAVGTLIDSEASRVNLGWKPPSEAKAEVSMPPDEVLKLAEQLNRLEDAVTKLAQPKDAVAPTGKDKTLAEAAPAKPTAPQPAPRGGIGDFLVAMFSFIPLNIGFLCILAAFIGGCSVNKEEIWQLKFDLNALQPGDDPSKGASLRRRLNYLTEHPGYSAIRGMVVYLILTSGLFIVGGDPLGDAGNQVDALTQYMRLAGLFSFFGYLAGYDPTVFTSLLNLGSSRLRPTQPETSPKP